MTKKLTFKAKVSILKGRCELTERKGTGWYGWSLNSKKVMFFYGKTLEDAVRTAELKGWFNKYENPVTVKIHM